MIRLEELPKFLMIAPQIPYDKLPKFLTISPKFLTIGQEKSFYINTLQSTNLRSLIIEIRKEQACG